MIEQHSAHGPFDIEDIEDLAHGDQARGLSSSRPWSHVEHCQSRGQERSVQPDLDQHVAEAAD